MHAKAVERLLMVPLTDEEMRERAVEMEKILSQMDDVDRQLAEKRAQCKEILASLRDDLVPLRKEIKQQAVEQLVPCTETHIYSNATVVVTRGDTGEIIGRREMTEDEKQMQIDDE